MVLAILFVAVPLAVWPGLRDPFTEPKWLLLELAAAIGAALESRRPGPWLPAFVRERPLACGLLAVLGVASAFRNGPAEAVEPLLARAAFVLVAWLAFRHFSPNGARIDGICLALAAASLPIVALGLAGFAGLRPLAFLRAGDGLSASFGHVNMAAQFAGLALLALLALPTPRAGLARAVRLALAVSLTAYLALLSSRSVWLALALALAIGVRRRQRSVRALLAAAGAAAALMAILMLLTPAARQSGALLQRKPASDRVRVGLWQGTLRLIADHPLGVGASNFGDAFLPYLRRTRLEPNDAVQYLQPHNELLRVLAEEGVIFTAAAGGLLLALARAVRHARRSHPPQDPAGALLAAGAAYIAVEAAFQFPFALAFGALASATLLGLALGMVEPPAGERVPRRSTWTGVLVMAMVLGVFTGVWRLGRAAALLASDGERAPDLVRSCQLNPRTRRACVLASWKLALEGRADPRLLERVLRVSPHYPPALRLLAGEAFARGDRPSGCLCLQAYDRLFRNRSSVHDERTRRCGVELDLAGFSDACAAALARMP